MGTTYVVGLWIIEYLVELHAPMVDRVWSSRVFRWTCYVGGLLAIILLGNFGRTEFIYFQF